MVFFFFFKSIDFIFQSSYRFIAKLKGKYWDFPDASYPHTLLASLIFNFPQQCCNWWTYIVTFVDTSVPPKVYLLHSSCLLVSYILWVWSNEWWHIATIMVSRRIVSLPLKTICALPIHPSFPTYSFLKGSFTYNIKYKCRWSWSLWGARMPTVLPSASSQGSPSTVISAGNLKLPPLSFSSWLREMELSLFFSILLH